MNTPKRDPLENFEAQFKKSTLPAHGADYTFRTGKNDMLTRLRKKHLNAAAEDIKCLCFILRSINCRSRDL